VPVWAGDWGQRPWAKLRVVEQGGPAGHRDPGSDNKTSVELARCPDNFPFLLLRLHGFPVFTPE